jgi:conjugal transfer pilin signal peptidase TrbI
MGAQTVMAPTQSNHDLVKRLIVLGAVSVTISFGMDRIVLAHGESVPITVFWKLPRSLPVKGDYVMFEISHPIIGPRPTKLTKQLVCDAGDLLQLRGDAFWCNGVRLGGFITRTWDDKPLTPFAYDGQIPEGQAFVMGSHPRSLDSRYLGLVDKAHLVRLAGLI